MNIQDAANITKEVSLAKYWLKLRLLKLVELFFVKEKETRDYDSKLHKNSAI